VIQELCDQEATMDMVKEKLEDEHDDKWGELDSIETSETMNHMMKEKKRSNPKRLTSWNNEFNADDFHGEENIPPL